MSGLRYITVVGDDRAAGGGGVGTHHAHQTTVEPGKAALAHQCFVFTKGTPIDVLPVQHGAAVGMAQALHRGQHICHRQHGEHVITTGINQPAQVLLLNHMPNHCLREVVERTGNRQMPVGRDGTLLIAVLFELWPPGGTLCKAFFGHWGESSAGN